MIQEYDSKKPPKNLKEFWNIFCDFNNKLQESLENERKNLKRHIPFAISTVVAIALIFVSLGIGYGWIHPTPEHIEASDVGAYDIIFRVGDVQVYKLYIDNMGDKLANDLRVEIKFPTNLTIDEVRNYDGLLIPNPDGGVDTNFYKPHYENINVNETIEIMLILKHKQDEFLPEESWEVPPLKVKIWTEDGDVSIS